jgi:hypothetical protein
MAGPFHCKRLRCTHSGATVGAQPSRGSDCTVRLAVFCNITFGVYSFGSIEFSPLGRRDAMHLIRVMMFILAVLACSTAASAQGMPKLDPAPIAVAQAPQVSPAESAQIC